MKGFLFAIAIIVILAHATFAFEMDATDQTFVVSSGGSNEIRISVNSATDDKITLDLIDETPWMTLNTSQLDIKKGQSRETLLYVSPYSTTSPGVYKVTVAGESLITNEKKLKDIFISVTRGEGVEVEKIEVSGNLEPLGNAVIKYYVKNLGSVALKDVTVMSTIRSPSGVFAESQDAIDLAPEERGIIEKFYALDSQQEAADYTVMAEVYQGGKLLDRFEQGFTIPKKTVIRQKMDQKTSLFRKEYQVTVTNHGNDVSDSTVITGSVGNFESYFYTGTPPTSVEGNVYIWDIRGLKPGETSVIMYAVDLTPFYLFIAASILMIWLFFFKMRIVRIKKFIMQKKLIEEGEEFTVGLELANKTGDTVEEVTVKDLVPLVFEVKDTEGPKPARRKTSAGTELVWHTKNLNNHEVRIFTYKIIPTFGVQGRVSIPRAQAFYGKKDKETHIISGFATIGIDPHEEDPDKRKLHHHVKRHVERLRKAVKRK